MLLVLRVRVLWRLADRVERVSLDVIGLSLAGAWCAAAGVLEAKRLPRSNGCGEAREVDPVEVDMFVEAELVGQRRRR